MKLKVKGSQQTELDLGNKIVFFSYDTPVAAWIDKVVYVTDACFSATTTRHINSWVNGWDTLPVVRKPQSFFDNLIK